MSYKTRTQDSNILRKTNKQYHQLEKNIFERNHFSSIAIVEEIIDAHWCSVKIIPSVGFNQFEASVGYTQGSVKNAVVKALIPFDITIEAGHIVLIVFTDVNFRNTIANILNGRGLDNDFIESDQTKHSLNFGIITNRVL